MSDKFEKKPIVTDTMIMVACEIAHGPFFGQYERMKAALESVFSLLPSNSEKPNNPFCEHDVTAEACLTNNQTVCYGCRKPKDRKPKKPTLLEFARHHYTVGKAGEAFYNTISIISRYLEENK